jgi:hypothetical protein
MYNNLMVLITTVFPLILTLFCISFNSLSEKKIIYSYGWGPIVIVTLYSIALLAFSTIATV